LVGVDAAIAPVVDTAKIRAIPASAEILPKVLNLLAMLNPFDWM
jgi:hypothetical protein